MLISKLKIYILNLTHNIYVKILVLRIQEAVKITVEMYNLLTQNKILHQILKTIWHISIQNYQPF